MPASHRWHPVTPSHLLRTADNVVPVMALGQPLALWRSADGQVQAWEDRCPHRGVALSLGRVLGDRLACAYHGWEYAAGNGRCVAIPAMPQQPVPGSVCVKTFATQERRGMVWVALEADAAPLPWPSDDASEPGPHFLRSITVTAPLAATEDALQAQAFTPAGSCQWRGPLADQEVQLWALDATADWCVLHAATDAVPSDPASAAALFGALRQLRDRLQAPRT